MAHPWDSKRGQTKRVSLAKGEKPSYLGLGRILVMALFMLSLEPCHLLSQGGHLAFQL